MASQPDSKNMCKIYLPLIPPRSTTLVPPPLLRQIGWEKTKQVVGAPCPMIYPVLSEHHWDAAEMKMIQERSTYVEAYSFFNVMEDYPSPPVWEYTLERDNTRSQTARRVVTHRSGKRWVTIAKLPKTKRCVAKIPPRVNKTGKGASRKPRKCKNKTYSVACHVHNNLVVDDVSPASSDTPYIV